MQALGPCQQRSHSVLIGRASSKQLESSLGAKYSQERGELLDVHEKVSAVFSDFHSS